MQQFTGLEYMKIYMANCMGLDKLTWDERLTWADSMLSNQNLVDKAIENADEPFLFIKTLHAYNDVMADIPTGFIMGLDATASGLQIMACLTGCHKTAENVNLINNGKRNDAYEKVAKGMNMPHIDRAAIKYPLMTHYYGSVAKPKEILGEDTPELKAFYDALQREFVGAEECKKDLQSCWQVDAEAHEFTLPDGHTMYVRVGEYEDKKIEVQELKNASGNNATFTHRAKVFKPSEHGISLPANVIHALDGWVVRELRRRCHAQGFDMIAVHDQFFCSPNYMNQLRQNYLDILIWIAEHDVMQEIISQLIGEPVKYTKLSNNLGEAMRNAEYALS